MPQFTLGDRVVVSHVYEFPSKDAMAGGATVSLAPAANPRADEVAVVVGIANRRVSATVIEGYTEDGKRELYLDFEDQTKAFYVVRYSLRGRQYLTRPEYMMRVAGQEEGEQG